MKRLAILTILLTLALPALAQYLTPVTGVATDTDANIKGKACIGSRRITAKDTGDEYYCKSGVWTPVPGGRSTSTRSARQYADAGAGTSGSPWTGWSDAVAASTTTTFEAGYYSAPAAGIALASGSSIVCEPGAHVVMSTSRTDALFQIPAGVDKVTIEGCNLDTVSTDYDSGVYPFLAKYAYVTIGTTDSATAATNITVTRNTFGLRLSGAGGVPRGYGVYVLGSGTNVEISHNYFQQYAALYFKRGSNTAQYTWDRFAFDHNRFVLPDSCEADGAACNGVGLGVTVGNKDETTWTFNGYLRDSSVSFNELLWTYFLFESRVGGDHIRLVGNTMRTNHGKQMIAFDPYVTNNHGSFVDSVSNTCDAVDNRTPPRPVTGSCCSIYYNYIDGGTVSGNTLTDPWCANVQIAHSTGITIVGNSLDKAVSESVTLPADAAINVSGGNSNIDIGPNTIVDPGKWGVYLSGVTTHNNGVRINGLSISQSYDTSAAYGVVSADASASNIVVSNTRCDGYFVACTSLQSADIENGTTQSGVSTIKVATGLNVTADSTFSGGLHSSGNTRIQTASTATDFCGTGTLYTGRVGVSTASPYVASYCDSSPYCVGGDSDGDACTTPGGVSTCAGHCSLDAGTSCTVTLTCTIAGKGTCVDTGTCTARSRQHYVAEADASGSTYNCDADWDGDGDVDCSDVKACLDLVAAAAGSGEAGSDHGIVALFGDRTYSCGAVSGMCGSGYELASGVTYRGVPPREVATDDAAPGLYMTKNGGTWFTCSDYADTLFTCNNCVGGGIEHVGAYQVGTFLSAGGDRANGWSKVKFDDIKVYGDDGTYASDIYGMVLYNSAFINANNLTFFHVDQGLHLGAWSCDWQPSNSVLSDVLVVTRNRSTTAAGILLDTTTPSGLVGCGEGAHATSLNYVTMIRPHVQNIYADPPAGSSCMTLDGVVGEGQVYGATILGADLEGATDYGIWLNDSATSNYINIAGCTGTAAVSDIRLDDSGVINNTIVNQCTTAKFYSNSSNNVVLGVVNELTSGSASPQGLYQIYDNSNFYTEGGRGTFSPTFSSQTGATPIFGSRVNAVFSSADGSNYVPFEGVYSTPSVNMNNAGTYRASLYGVNSAPVMAGAAATNANAIANFIGVTADPQITATGDADTSHTIAAWTGVRAKLTDGGSYWTATAARGFEVDTTGIGSSLPTGGAITTYEGLRIGDLSALGTQNNAIAIASQTAGVNTGNFRFIGGDYNTGHLAFAAFNDAGRAHVWFDGTNDRLAFHVGDPAATDDADFALSEAGIRFEGATNDGIEMILTTTDPTSADKTVTLPNATGMVQLTGNSTHAGTLMWGDCDDTTDTGTEVCALAGLTCVSASTMAGVAAACATDQGTAGSPNCGGAAYFYALCR